MLGTGDRVLNKAVSVPSLRAQSSISQDSPILELSPLVTLVNLAKIQQQAHLALVTYCNRKNLKYQEMYVMKTDSSLIQSPMVMFLGGSSLRAHQEPRLLSYCGSAILWLPSCPGLS